MVVARGADVALGMRRPGHAVDAGAVVVEFGDGRAGHAHVEDNDFGRVEGEGGEEVGVLFVPGKAEQGLMAGVLVDNGGVFEMAEVEHSD